MQAAQSEIAAALASWAIATARLDQKDMHEEARALFTRMCAELSLVDARGAPLLPACTESALCDFVRTVTCVWTGTPYIWTAMATAPRVPELRMRFELDPARLLSCIVWAYVLEHGVQYIEEHPQDAMRITEIWRVLAEGGSLGGALYTRVKRASTISDPRVHKEPRTAYALTLNVNIIEAVVADIGDLQLANAWNGAALVGNFMNRVAPGTIRHHHDFGEFHLSDEWIRLYVLWNLSFACRFDTPEFLCKLLIPSVVRGTGARWLSHRVVTLRMTCVSSWILSCVGNWDLRDERAHFARQAAAIRPSVVRSSSLVVRTAENAAVFALENTTRALVFAAGMAEAYIL